MKNCILSVGFLKTHSATSRAVQFSGRALKRDLKRLVRDKSITQSDSNRFLELLQESKTVVANNS